MNDVLDLPTQRIFGTGEMAQRTRDFDWLSVGLPAIAEWPAALLITVNTLLASRQPMILWWGLQSLQFYNDAFRRDLGTGKHPTALGQQAVTCWPEAWEIIDRRIQTVHTGESTWFEDCLVPIHRNGRLEDVYWTWSDSPVRDTAGNVCGVLVVCADVTQRILAQQALNTSEERLRIALSSARDMGTFDWDIEKNIVHADAPFCSIFGIDPALGATGGPITAFFGHIHPDDLPEVQKHIEHAIATGSDYSVDYRVCLPSQEIRWIAARGNCIHDTSGRPVRFPGIVIDITQRKRDEEALRDSEERLRLALAAARDMGTFDWLVAPDRVYADQDYCRIAGIDPTIGRDGSRPVSFFVERMHPDDRAAVDAAIQETVRTGNEYAIDYRFLHEDGSVRWVSARGSCVYDEKGQPTRFPGVVIDITERRLTEAALLQNEKLAAVGRLASSIAHEINNPLESVTNLIYLAKSTAAVPETIQFLDQADTELRRVAAITNLTLRFHKQASRPTSMTCTDLIGDALAIHQSRLVNSNITVEKRKRAHLPVTCFEGEIRQVLSNLVGNAIDAMNATGGRLLLRSREATDWPTGRPGLVVTVADSGPGMNPATAAHAFDAFFTTKGIHGTGLGLWISKDIIARHHGTLRLRSSQHSTAHGTVFTLFLPFAHATR